MKKGKKEMTESKELATKQEQTTALSTEMMAAGWGSEGIDSRDLIIPKILLMQGLSDAVSEGKAKMGDLIDSLSLEKVGDKENPVEVIPVSTFKTWVISFKPAKGNKFEYVRTINAVEGQDLALEEEGTLADAKGDRAQEGDEKVVGTIRRDRTINAYVLEVGNPSIPKVISFRRTSYKAGRVVVSHFASMAAIKQPPAAKTLRVGCRLEKNDEGNYYVYDVMPGRVSKKEDVALAFDWFKKIRNSRDIKVDESDLAKPEEKDVTAETAQY